MFTEYLLPIILLHTKMALIFVCVIKVCVMLCILRKKALRASIMFLKKYYRALIFIAYMAILIIVLFLATSDISNSLSHFHINLVLARTLYASCGILLFLFFIYSFEVEVACDLTFRRWLRKIDCV